MLIRNAGRLSPGDFAQVTVERADAFDLVARLGEATLTRAPLPPPPRMHRVISRA